MTISPGAGYMVVVVVVVVVVVFFFNSLLSRWPMANKTY